MSVPSIPVSVDFINTYVPKANPHYIGVYLYLLAQKGNQTCVTVSLSACAEELHLLATDIDMALRYWQEEGLLHIDSTISEPLGYVLSFTALCDVPCESMGMKINKNQSLKTMLLLAQNILGKPLNLPDTKTLVSFYEGLGLPIDVILMLLEFCVSHQHTRMSYIEKTAIAWHKLGLNNIQAAENYVSQTEQQEIYQEKAAKALQLEEGRHWTANEKKHLVLWQEKYQSSIALITLAGEYCHEQIGKLSIPYVSAILKSWHEQGITSVKDAKHGNQTYNTAVRHKAAPALSSQNVYDYDEINKLAATKLKKYSTKDNG